MTEDEQIRTIAGTVKSGAVVGFIVDDDAKADRFIARLRVLCPQMTVTFRGPLSSRHSNVLVKVQMPSAGKGNN